MLVVVESNGNHHVTSHSDQGINAYRINDANFGFAPIKEILALCEKVNLNAPIVIENLNEQTAVLSLQYLKKNNIVI